MWPNAVLAFNHSLGGQIVSLGFAYKILIKMFLKILKKMKLWFAVYMYTTSLPKLNTQIIVITRNHFTVYRYCWKIHKNKYKEVFPEIAYDPYKCWHRKSSSND